MLPPHCFVTYLVKGKVLFRAALPACIYLVGLSCYLVAMGLRIDCSGIVGKVSLFAGRPGVVDLLWITIFT